MSGRTQDFPRRCLAVGSKATLSRSPPALSARPLNPSISLLRRQQPKKRVIPSYRSSLGNLICSLGFGSHRVLDEPQRCISRLTPPPRPAPAQPAAHVALPGAPTSPCASPRPVLLPAPLLGKWCHHLFLGTSRSSSRSEPLSPNPPSPTSNPSPTPGKPTSHFTYSAHRYLLGASYTRGGPRARELSGG